MSIVRREQIWGHVYLRTPAAVAVRGHPLNRTLLMARFDKLEFNARKRPPPEPNERDPLSRDAGYWMNQADKSRRSGLYESAICNIIPGAGVGSLAGGRLGWPGADAGAVG